MKGKQKKRVKAHINEGENGFHVFAQDMVGEFISGDRFYIANTPEELGEVVKKIYDGTIDEIGETTE